MRRRNPILIGVILTLFSSDAFAVFAAKTPPSSLYAESRAVVLGQITKISPDSGVIEASATALNGESPADTIRIKFDNLPAVLKGAKEGQPLVLFLGKRATNNALHIADAWYLPEPGARGNYVVRKDKQAELRQSYPGTTSALVKIAQELKANAGAGGPTTRPATRPRFWYSMLDKTSPDMFKGGAKDLGTASTLKLPKPAGNVVFGNFGEDTNHMFAIAIKDGGVFRHAINAEGAPAEKPDGDFTRLTGEPVGPYQKRFAGATAAALDCNGDGRSDVLINSPAGPMLLINRGFGCFFVNADVDKTLGDALPANAKWTALDVDGDKHDDLVVLSDDGKATAILNPPR